MALAEAADSFAEELTEMLQAVLGDAAPAIVPEAASSSGPQTRISMRAPEPITLTIDGCEALTLNFFFLCTWDSREEFLKVRKSGVTVSPLSERSEPLFRYEFDAAMGERFPSGHIQIHAHRDEFLYALLRAGTGKPRARREGAFGERRKEPHLSNVHFAVGGERFRPILEDVLHMLIEEFGIDVEKGASAVLATARGTWRVRQLKACVRDCPEVAAEVLTKMGYAVTPPSETPNAVFPEWLTKV